MSSKRKGDRSERDVADRLNLTRTSGSGSGARKGDARNDWLMLEHKSTKARSMTVQLGWLRKLVAQARGAGAREPILSVSFTDPNEAPLRDGCWVMMREGYFKDLIDRTST